MPDAKTSAGEIKNPRDMIDANEQATRDVEGLLITGDKVSEQMAQRHPGKVNVYADTYRGSMERVINTGRSAVATAINVQLSTAASETKATVGLPSSTVDYKGKLFDSTQGNTPQTNEHTSEEVDKTGMSGPGGSRP